MTEDQKLTDLAQEFITRLREHLSNAIADDPDVAVERVISTSAVAIAAILLLLPGKRRDTLVFSLIATAARHWFHKPPEPPVKLVK